MGVAIGATLWFLLLAYGVSRGQGRISPRVLLRMEHVSGALLLAAALWIGGRIVWHLHREHQNERRENGGGAVVAFPGSTLGPGYRAQGFR